MEQMKKFGTFGGVFTPTLLTILGVIMYLRLGWVVGNAGLLGAWVIILLAYGITLCTALSMSSITTNIRIGAGGAYAIISQALGLEVGGSLGIPRYISQALAVTMYIFGFREGWLTIFPTHHPFLVDLIVFVVLYGIAYKSADLAIKTQFIIMGVIGLSLISIAFAAFYGSMEISTEEAVKWGTFKGVEGSTSEEFWLVFAVFFPAATGIMAGANMSGELKDPRKSIPSGTLWAIGVSLVIYMVLALWIGRTATEDEMISNYNIIIEKSFFPPLVIAGVLGATFSSALASIIGSSRILFAMGQHRVLPNSEWLEFQDSIGQPRNAMIVTGILIFLTMLLRDLNAVAPLVTMFFLITYAMLNVVVIIEQNLGLISFRPIFVVHKIIPWIGLAGSLLAMFIINPTVSLISWTLMFFVYNILSRRKLETQFEDVRSGLFTSFAEWAAKRTAENAHKEERSWKPNMLIPVTDSATVQGSFSIIRDIAFPKGSAVLMGVNDNGSEKEKQKLEYISRSFKKAEVFSSTIVMRTSNFADGVNFGNQAFSGAYFRPNIIFLNMLEQKSALTAYPEIIEEAKRLELGVILYMPHPRAMLGQQQTVNVWIKSREPNWDINDGEHNPNLALLIAYKLRLNWNAEIRLITVVKETNETKRAKDFLQQLINLARLPINETLVLNGDFEETYSEAPIADINIFGIFPGNELAKYEEMSLNISTTCFFVMNSGHENIFA
ncbi:MAG: amino acid permease [Bacteroidetes bacterium]|jgi:amino acid transporter|nr:amino acid permease [Bacteroidota bacterium]